MVAKGEHLLCGAPPLFVHYEDIMLLVGIMPERNVVGRSEYPWVIPHSIIILPLLYYFELRYNNYLFTCCCF